MFCVDVIIYSSGEIGLDPDMIKLEEADIGVEYANGKDDQKTKIHAAAKERYLAACFFWGIQTPIWQTHREHREQFHPKCEPVSKNDQCST